MHQPRRKLLIRLHDFHRGISKARGEGRWGPQENNSWRLTVTDRGGNWFTGVFLPGKIPPRRDTTLRWPGRGMRLIRPPRVLLPQKITAAHPPPLILEITFPGIPPPALFFPMVAGYFSGGQRSRDTRSLFIRSIVDGWTWCTTLGKSDFDVYVNDNDNVSKNRKIFVFAYVWLKFGREETIKEIRENLTRGFRGWRPRIATHGVYIPFAKDSSTIFPCYSIPLCLRLRIVCV